jgi:uroporphyrinogen-III decarboxylase
MKQYFLQRSHREQMLLTLFVVFAGAIWIFAAAGRLRARLQEARLAHADSAAQQLWLDRQADIEARAAAAIKSLDPARTFDATRLASEISTMAREAGLTINTEPPRTTQTPQLAIHSVQVTSRRAALSALLKFYEALNERAPYLGLEQCSLLVERNSGGLLTATLQVSSVEVIRAHPPAK